MLKTALITSYGALLPPSCPRAGLKDHPREAAMRERFAQAYPTSFRRWEAARADEECDLPYAGSFGGSEDSPFE